MTETKPDSGIHTDCVRVKRTNYYFLNPFSDTFARYVTSMVWACNTRWAIQSEIFKEATRNGTLGPIYPYEFRYRNCDKVRFKKISKYKNLSEWPEKYLIGKKCLILWSNFKFGFISGQILKSILSRFHIDPNDALEISLTKKLVFRSQEVIRGHQSS